VTIEEYRALLAEHRGSFEVVIRANLDRSAEIVDAAVRAEHVRPVTAGGDGVLAVYVPKGRKWFEDIVDRVRHEERDADREEQEARIRDLQERELQLRLDAAEHRDRGGRPKGSYVREETFWVVWKMVLE